MTVRIAMWSGPRNISTAMMRAWENRSDCAVRDEPFYACYLAATGLDHPMRAEVIAAGETDWDRVAAACATDAAAPVVFQKHMAQHMIAAAPTGWMAACRHAFLIRPPEEVAPSFARAWDGIRPEALGFARQAELFAAVAEREGRAPPVVEAGDVLADPAGMLRALCAALGVGFDPAMLAWPAGPRDSDGVWAAHWYAAVRASTGFARPEHRAPPAPLPAPLAAVVEACRPHYETMRAHRLAPLPA